MKEKWAKWAILDIATEGFLEGLCNAIGELNDLFPDDDNPNIAKKLLPELIQEGLVELFYEKFEPTGATDEKRRQIIRSNPTAIEPEKVAAILDDPESWELGLEVRITYIA